MVDDEPSYNAAAGAHHNPRQLVRLIQCPHCSNPFIAPVTLPCGHTVCRACLPAPRPRANVSYPNTPDRLQGVTCPLPACGAEHAAAECCVDVTLSKIMELIDVTTREFKSSVRDSPTSLVEILGPGDHAPMEEKEKGEQTGHQMVLHGGRLLSTFLMAQKGKLRWSSDVQYSFASTHESLHHDQYEYEHLDIALLRGLQDQAQEEMKCQVCYHTMLDPTTTACGHSFCRRCLIRVMDHSSICPLCRRGLHTPASLQNKPSNHHLASLLDMLCPDLMAERLAAINFEEQAGADALDTPLFICTLALPSMPTFIHVFEPRYRLMMRRCMEGNKRFGMVMYNRAGGSTPFQEYGTMLEIVNLELLHDGRSFVETIGVGRFRIQEHGMLDGYIIGRVEKLEDVSVSDEQDAEQQETTAAQQLVRASQRENPLQPVDFRVSLNQMSTQELLDFCTRFVGDMRRASAPWLNHKIVQVYGEPPDDPALFPYWFACVLPIAEEEKYVLLHVTRVRERLKIVKTWIDRIQNQRQ